MSKQHIFALDIGTRSVVGVILQICGDKLEILAAEAEEHQKRSMQDGQIHDVEEVAKVVTRIKASLEEKVKFPLTNVAVAAAGRALKTIRTKMDMAIDRAQEINLNAVLALELQAVQEAQRQLLENEDNSFHNYQCVGYSVIQYLLNGSKMKSLIGQRGDQIAIELIATFLPREVVDSLFAVLDRAGLEMSGLTLEPIAASEVVIPESMRQLSLALVDIGAGTSDIAICADGTMVAFAMVPEAGDEVTEVLAEAYLLDFHEAERVKRMVCQGGQITYHDVLGNEHTISAEQLTAFLQPRVNAMTSRVAEKVLTLSPKPVQAVFCIGGGSLTPGYAAELAEQLNLSPQRVAVRGREVVNEVSGSHEKLKGPESITPLGIAVTAFRGHGLDFSRVVVNGQPVRLFKLNHGTVADALLAAGLDTKKLMGKWGMSLSVSVNGEVRLVKGTLGLPATITINHQPAHLNTFVTGGDNIVIEAAVNGTDATGRVGDVLPEVLEDNWIIVNGEKHELSEAITMNGRMVTRDEPLVDLAEIVLTTPTEVADIAALRGIDNLEQYEVMVNGAAGEANSKIHPGDYLQFTLLEQFETLGEAVQPTDPESEPFVIRTYSNEPLVYVNENEIDVSGSTGALLFFDIFKYFAFDPQPPFAGAELIIEVNGKPATFTTPIHYGDKLTLTWSKDG